MAESQKLLEIKNLKKYFPIRTGFFRRVHGYVRAVDDVSFDLYRGETLGVVGESGCGKTTLIKTIIRAIDPTEGSIVLHGKNGETHDVATADKTTLRALRRDIQMVFQDPHSSLDPRQTVRDIIGEPLYVNGIAKKNEIDERVRELMAAVGLDPGYLKRYPHAFSGGQRQRIGVARALSLNPELILADEPTSALDVSVQAQLLNLLSKLQKQFSLTYIFISHDLTVVRHISDRVAVMYVGKIVEVGSTDELFIAPQHPYTEALLAAVPYADRSLKTKRIVLSGDVASPSAVIPGCKFHPRCPYAQERCRVEVPELRAAPGVDGRIVACHRAEELSLAGVKVPVG